MLNRKYIRNALNGITEIQLTWHKLTDVGKDRVSRVELLKALESIRTPFGDQVWSALTYLGQEAFLIGIMCLLFWCFNKKFAYKIGFAFFACQLVVQDLKVLFKVERPWVKDPSFRPVEGALAAATGYSFPSGHTCAATAVYTTCGLNLKNKFLKFVAFAAIPIVMFSRMYLGVHTPQDVCVSFCISFAIAIAAYFIEKKLTLSGNSSLIIMIVFIAVTTLAFVYCYYRFKSGAVEEKYVLDCAKVIGAGIGFIVSWFIERTYINFDEKKGSVIEKIIRVVIGIAVLFGIKTGLKALLGDGMVGDVIRYFALIAWGLLAYPALIKVWQNRQSKTA